MDKLNKITVPASQKLRQLQKMVHDIKNNEGGIMNKIKKLKVKAPPSVPQRDYASENPADEEEQWSDDFDSDYEHPDEHSDSEMYVLPAEETGDDSYEPPPGEQETRTVHPALPFARGEYIDNRSSQRQSPPFSKTLPSKPDWPSAKARARVASTLPALTSLQKPQVPPKPKELEDEVDYVVPVDDEDENYIHPTEDCSLPAEKAPMVNRSVKPNNSSKPASPPGTASGRNSGVWDAKSPSPAAPSPLPRAGKKPATPLKTIPVASPQNVSSVCEERPIPAERHRTSSHRQENMQSSVFPPPQKQIHHKPVPLPRFPEGGSSTVDGLLSSNPHLSEQEADIHCKPWYAGACDRKSAEEALYRSNKDGSFLIRKSSGHDSKQPYTLVVFFNKRVYNIPVRFIEATKQYALGRKKNGEEYFGSVAEIIKNHQHSPLVLIDNQNNTKDSTRLKYAVKVS
ncbi:B-cell linker protein isoform X2 [Mustela nigripes]|uniref:B-cell linker protein isoform X12 n=1 Tax=Mustela putorius furo TaxID=9669 RepID=A0A8U0MNR8_MUSPF|nr:B-cell linker protein isoform X12 [Mustela putorius furo]XP_059254221.1 B-cell linker protein isoform X2 [Mustela nigripes]